LASHISPDFDGYLVAECNFYPARGYAFICDRAAKNLATGYLAEIIKVENAVCLTPKGPVT
jgi:hypothetical protein